MKTRMKKMKIIKEGDIKLLKRVKRFECPDCGCIFEADKGEYQCGSQYNQEYYSCKCPTCGRWTHTE